MNAVAVHRFSDQSNPDCRDFVDPDFMAMGERELSAFFTAVTQLFGAEQAELSAADWVQELIEIDGLPASTSEWRLITAKASTRLANLAKMSSYPNEFTNS